MTISKKSFSPGQIIIILVALLSLIFFHPWTDRYTDSLISWDKLGYYLYLPSLFIYKDWHYFSFMQDYFQTYQPSATWYQTLITPDWKHVITYPIGVSYFQLPFFLLGHLCAKIFNYPLDGFSQPYVFFAYLSGLFYVIAGLFFCIKSLRYFFQIKNSWIIVLILLLSTNLYYYGMVDNIMPHSYSFFLLSIVVYYSIKWQENQSFKNILILGLSIGFMISIRSTDIVSVFIPLLFGIYDKESYRNKINLIKKNSGKITIAILIGTIPFLIQMLYWHYATGYWLFNAYSYTYLGFSWTNPNILHFLVTFRKGWFVYTPVMLLSIYGLLQMKETRLKMFLPATIVFLIVNLYIYSAWNSWWFGGSFGQRSMVQSYAVLLIPFTSGIIALNKFKYTRVGLYFFISICIVMNLLFTWIYKNSLMLTDGMTRSMFKDVLLHPTSAYIPESKRINDMRWKDEWIQSQNFISEDTSLRTLHNGDFSNIMDSKGEDVLNLKYKWLRCTFETQFQQEKTFNPSNLHIVNEIKNDDHLRFWKGKFFTDQFAEKNKMSDWVKRTVDFRIPVTFDEVDKYLLYFWDPGEQTVNVKNVKVFGLILKDNN